MPSPSITCAKACKLLKEHAFWLTLDGANEFRLRAWRKAAETLDEQEGLLGELVQRAEFAELEGFGSSTREAVQQMAKTGSFPALENLRERFPHTLLELRQVRGLGAKKILQLHGEGISSRKAMREALDSGVLSKLKGFGGNTLKKLDADLRELEAAQGRLRLDVALSLGARVREKLLQLPAVGRVEALGELRRECETVIEPTLLIETTQENELRTQLAELEGVAQLDGFIQLSLPEVEVPFLLQFSAPANFTTILLEKSAHPEHLKALKNQARSLQLPWPPLAEANTEEDLYQALKLPHIDPVLREGMDELELAQKDKLPKLLEKEQLRGTFHNHTTASDGRHSLREMADAAQELGLEYLGIADHSVGAVQANGLSAERLRAQIAQIAELNAEYEAAGVNFRLFAGSEVEVKKDGSLDFEDELLAQLDYVVAALHVPHSLSEAVQTERAIRAIEHPLVTMLAHPSARLLLRRPATPMDVKAVAEAAAEAGKVVEINANPWRLDMDWRIWRELGEKAPLCSINPDAHAMGELGYLDIGVRMARKAALSSAQVLNTKSLEEVSAWLARG